MTDRGTTPPTYGAPSQVPAPRHLLVPPERLAERKGVVSVLGSARRAGSWTLPRHLRVVATFGNAELDLREATFSEGTTDIELFTLFGSVQLTVPPGVRVDCDVDTFGASAEVSGASGGAPAAASSPVVRLRGTAVFASVEVRVRAVGEDGILATVKRALRG